MEIKKEIEEQRRRLDQLAEKADHLTDILEEARKMDRLVERYEASHVIS